MSEQQHTPGPWIVFNGDDDFDVLPAGREGEIAARIRNTHDAQLIAAAPDLLHMCRVALADLELCGRGKTTTAHAIFAAITKATVTAS